MSAALIIGLAVLALIIGIALRQRARVTHIETRSEKDGDNA